ncbi:MAG TPA: DUF4261 domain-containing protein [Verrucomicrobiae bacterium]
MGMTVEKKDDIPSVAMIALRQNSMPAAKDVVQAFKKLWNEETSEEIEDDSFFGFNTSEGQIVCGLMPAPIPWEELEGPCETSPFWENATKEMRGHKAHLIVTANPRGENPVNASRLLTKAVAAILKTKCGIGVYWGAGTLVNSSETFLEHAAQMSAECLPLYLWVDFRVVPDEGDTLTLFTTGMEALGLMEIEMVQAQIEPEEAVDLVFNFAHYLLENGPVLKDGDSIGMSETQHIQIQHAPSLFDVRGNVYRLTL